jgi:flagellar hook assembly protein FlgD
VATLENITINIYDIKGNKIETVFSGLLNKGNYTFSWDGKNNATGIYMIQCSSENISKSQKIFLIK